MATLWCCHFPVLSFAVPSFSSAPLIYCIFSSLDDAVGFLSIFNFIANLRNKVNVPKKIKIIEDKQILFTFSKNAQPVNYVSFSQRHIPKKIKDE